MRLAILLSGYEFWQQEEVQRFARFLIPRLDEVRIIGAAELPNEEIEKEVTSIADALTTEDFLLIYISAHGHRGGAWSFGNDSDWFDHIHLTGIVDRTHCQILVINDSCFAGSLARTFEECRVDSARVGVIGAVTAAHEAYSGDLVNGLMAAWEHGQAYQPSTVYTKERGGPPFLLGPPIGLITVGEPLIRAWDRFRYHCALLVYRLACRIWPYESEEVQTMRWGAMYDNLFW